MASNPAQLPTKTILVRVEKAKANQIINIDMLTKSLSKSMSLAQPYL